MAKHRFTARIDISVFLELEVLAKRRGTNINDLVNEACKQYIVNENRERIDQLYFPIVEKKLDEYIKRMENRIASGVYRNAYDTAQLLFMMLPIAAEAFGEEEEALFQRTRGIAVKHVNRSKGE